MLEFFSFWLNLFKLIMREVSLLSRKQIFQIKPPNIFPFANSFVKWSFYGKMILKLCAKKWYVFEFINSKNIIIFQESVKLSKGQSWKLVKDEAHLITYRMLPRLYAFSLFKLHFFSVHLTTLKGCALLYVPHFYAFFSYKSWKRTV